MPSATNSSGCNRASTASTARFGDLRPILMTTSSIASSQRRESSECSLVDQPRLRGPIEDPTLPFLDHTDQEEGVLPFEQLGFDVQHRAVAAELAAGDLSGLLRQPEAQRLHRVVEVLFFGAVGVDEYITVLSRDEK